MAGRAGSIASRFLRVGIEYCILVTLKRQVYGPARLGAACDGLGELHVSYSHLEGGVSHPLKSADSVDELLFHPPAALLFRRNRYLREPAIAAPATI